MRLVYTVILFIVLLVNVDAQNIYKTKDGYLVAMAEVNGELMPQIKLNTVYVMPPKVFKNERERRRFTRLVRKVKKVLPYAIAANNMLIEIEDSIRFIDKHREQKKYIKIVEKRLKERYGDELKNLTISEGRILIKLIDRETGNTSYELVKELRGSFSAFMWQSLARLFGENLKVHYDPKGQDKEIEEIIIRLQAGEY